MPVRASSHVGQEESVVAEMIITIADGCIECHTTTELMHVLLYVTAVLEDEVHNVQIAAARLGITAISLYYECKVSGFSLFYFMLS